MDVQTDKVLAEWKLYGVLVENATHEENEWKYSESGGIFQ